MEGKTNKSSVSMIVSLRKLINVIKNKGISSEQNLQTKNANVSINRINSLEEEKNAK